MENLFLQGLTVEQLMSSLREIVKQEVSCIKGPEQEEKLLSPAAACEMFIPKISKSTLHQWTVKGLLQAHYLGGRKWYKQSEILAKMETLKPYSPLKKAG